MAIGFLEWNQRNRHTERRTYGVELGYVGGWACRWRAPAGHTPHSKKPVATAGILLYFYPGSLTSPVPTIVVLPEDHLSRGCVNHTDLTSTRDCLRLGSKGHGQGPALHCDLVGPRHGPVRDAQGAVALNPKFVDELGVHEPPVPTARLIASAMGVPLAYMYCEDDKVAALLCGKEYYAR